MTHNNTDFLKSINCDNYHSVENCNGISHNTNSTIQSVPTEDIYYNTNHTNIGAAIIFSHNKVDGNENERVGNRDDTKRIAEALRSFGFRDKIYEDKTFKEIKEILTKVSNEDHLNNDCLVVVVMSYGTDDAIHAKDMTYPVESLWKPFLEDNCESLKNKPKLFFIQACRGDQIELPVRFKVSRTDDHDAPTTTATYRPPNAVDLLIMYSSFEGTFSWRKKNHGAWFIQSLSHVLEEAAKSKKEEDLYDLLTAVSRKVAFEYQTKYDKIKAMPNFVSTLTKIFKFKPKNNSTITFKEII